MWIIWFDDSKKSAAQKIAAGCAAYRERYDVDATQVLVNEVDFTVVPGIQVEPRATVRPNNFWVGVVVQEGAG